MDDLEAHLIRWQQEMDQDECQLLDILDKFDANPDDWFEVTELGLTEKWTSYCLLGLLRHRQLSAEATLERLREKNDGQRD